MVTELSLKRPTGLVSDCRVSVKGSVLMFMSGISLLLLKVIFPMVLSQTLT